MSALTRLYWTLIDRRMMSLRHRGFYAHWLTKKDGELMASEYVVLHKGTHVANAEIGRFTYIQGATCIRCKIGAFCSIGPGAMIGGIGKHPTNRISTSPVFYSKRNQLGITFATDSTFDETPTTIIGNDVWIGAEAMILDGITIGNGAIIGARALVTKDVEPYTIVGGVPARTIRMRYDKGKADEINAIEWWNWPIKRLKAEKSFFQRPVM